MRSYSAILIYSVVAIVAARAASAQAGSAVASAPTPPATAPIVFMDGKPIGAAEPWSAKPVGAYDLVIPTGDAIMIATLTISEVAGKLSAKFVQLEGPEPMMMDVAVNGTDLVLTVNRPRDPITVHLLHRGQQLSGNWNLGTEQSGTLEGKAKPQVK
jgi:hypothetical protein